MISAGGMLKPCRDGGIVGRYYDLVLSLFRSQFVVAWRRAGPLQGLVSTARRGGVPFVRTRRRGLCSMSGRYPYGIGNPPTLRRSSFPQRALRPAGGPYQNTLGAVPQDPLTLKLRLDTNWTFQQMLKSRSVRRRRYALKVPAVHFILDSAGTELKINLISVVASDATFA